eukprot:c16642_g2_i1 orf=1-576(-)
MAAAQNVDATALSKVFNLRDIITNQDLRKLTRLRRPWGRLEACTGRSRQYSSMYRLVRAGPLETGQSTSGALVHPPILPSTTSPVDFIGRGMQWRSICSVITSQWATTQMEKSSPDLELDVLAESPNSVLGPDSPPSKLITLPKPLSVTDLTSPPSHGSTIRVAYQGVPGAYSEAAAGKAFPKCEAVPCEQF